MSRSHLGIPQLFRAVAIAIAVLAALDPGCVRTRRDRPLVAVMAGATVSDSARAQRIVRDLADRFTLVPGWLPAADALVLTGDRLPDVFRHEAPSVPVFMVGSADATSDIRLRALRAPTQARVGERISIDAYVAYGAAPGDSLELAVRRDGVLLARETVAARRDRAEHHHTLTVIASDTGAVAFDVTARLTESTVRSEGTVLVEVHDTPIRVVSHDTRPTWFGTFARRALVADARFDVTSRTMISRMEGVPITTSVGAPPSLAALPAPPALDVVVVGAANALDVPSVDALDRWVRSGGSAVLLLDDAPSPSVQRWLAVDAWRRVDQAAPQRARFMAAFWRRDVAGDGTDGAANDAPLLGRQWLVPTRLPNGSEPWMQLADSSPVVWSQSIGAGTLIVSGALDAWTFRGAARSDFGHTWPRIVAEAASRIAPPVSLTVRPSVAGVGTWRDVEVSTRNAELDSTAAPFTLAVSVATARTDAGPTDSLPLHPRGDGRWGAEWRDTTTRDGHVARVLSATGQQLAAARLHAGTPFADAPHPSVLRSLADATGGRVLERGDVDALGDALDAALTPASRQHPWHPMRSPWWLLPFTGALLAEWWWRRRAGRP
jgi:hypothetical protein